MKKLLLMSLLAASIFTASAQDSTGNTSLKSLTRLDLGFGGVGFTYEPRLGNKMTMDLSAGAGGGYNVHEGGVDYRWDLLQPSIYFIVNPKLYYNRQKRIRKGKSVLNNSGNYFGLRLKYTTESISSGNSYSSQAALVNLHWGMQRPLGKKWVFNAHAGLGYARDIGTTFGTIYPALDVKFAYLFLK
ncbi:MAG: hypothetical protein EOP45_12250 [Sphingobacteriaceae bacterium]|nr:MAG: hypothetical protein EOP45_12250 [Sphingobacteriaceae bacterium]